MGFARTLFAGCLILWAPVAVNAAETPPAYSLPALGEDLDGVWAGSLAEAGMDMAIAFTVKSGGGKSTVRVDIANPTSNGIPVSGASRDGARTRFEMKDIGGAFEGVLASDRNAIQGTWVQAGKRIPLILKRRAAR